MTITLEVYAMLPKICEGMWEEKTFDWRYTYVFDKKAGKLQLNPYLTSLGCLPSTPVQLRALSEARLARLPVQ
jgi:hypothetical protein